MPIWTHIRSSVLIASAIVATIAGGVVHGHWTHRWGNSDVVADAAAKLGKAPDKLGDWRLVRPAELSAVEHSILQNHGYLGGLYRHEQTGDLVQLSMILGPLGQTSAHIPEVCLGSHAFAASDGRRHLRLPGGDDEFWTSTFRTKDVAHRPLRAVYAWRFNEAWSAPQQPRITFGGSPYLYKLQLICYADDEASQRQCEDFLKAAVPALRERLR